MAAIKTPIQYFKDPERNHSDHFTSSGPEYIFYGIRPNIGVVHGPDIRPDYPWRPWINIWRQTLT